MGETALRELDTTEVAAAAKVRSVYDQLAPQYDEGYSDAKSLAENRLVKRLLGRERLVEGDVIDLGCGTGLLLELVDVPAKRYLGVDVSPGMLSRARAKFPGHQFVEGDMADLRVVGDASFDAVVCLFGAWDYCLRPDLAAREALRVLRPKGQLFLMACSHLHQKRQAYLVKKELGVDLERRLYGAGELTGVLSEAGFCDVRVSGVFRVGDMLPKRTPGAVFDLAMKLEVWAGRVVPNSFYYLTAFGRKG